MKKSISILLSFFMAICLYPKSLNVFSADINYPCLTGSFIQPQLVSNWTHEHWLEEYSQMKEIGMDHLILQWTAETQYNTTIYPTSISGFNNSYSYDVVEKALSMADEMDLDVYVGLQLNHDFFIHYANNINWLNQEAVYSEALVRELWAEYGHHESFKGWYLPFEVDNWNYNLPAGSVPDTNKLQNLVNYYNDVIPVINQLSPGKPVMTSPFYNINPDTSVLQPAGWRTMWRYILERTDFNIIALQDGIGAGHAITNEIAPWYEATLNAIKDAGKESVCELWSDVETFSTDWQPLPTNTIIADMNAVRQYVTNYTSFSFNHYMSTQAVRPEYYQTYKNYYETGIVDPNLPSIPSALTGVSVDNSTVSLAWEESSDDIGVVGYNIYRNGILVKKTYSSGITFTDTQLNENTQYVYSVSAHDAAGNESIKSNTVTVSTPAGTEFKNKYSGNYTYSIPPADPYTDTSRTKLTNGSYGRSGKGDIYSEWAGLSGAGPFVITLDMGSAKMINKISANFLQIKEYYIMLPGEIILETSTDGMSYSQFDIIEAAAADDSDQTKMYQSINFNGETARYVRLTLIPTGSAWTFIDEIEVWGGFDTVPVTGVTLDKNSMTITEGDTDNLTATVNPSNAANKNIIWSSSNPDVASVDNGVITAVSQGTATITVTTADGGKNAVCTVTVMPFEELEISEITILKKEKTLTFNVNAAGGKGGMKFAFYIIGDGNIYHKIVYSDVNYFSYTPEEEGGYSLRAYAIDSSDKRVVFSKSFTY